MGFERSMDFIDNQHGVLGETLLMAEMARFGEGAGTTDIFVSARYVLHKGVFEVGYVPILGFAIFGLFDRDFGPRSFLGQSREISGTGFR